MSYLAKLPAAWKPMTWKDEATVALNEMMFELSKTLDDKFEMDKQTANAMLIGIVDQTERYKSCRTRAETMHISGELLELGADPHLVAENLALASNIPLDLPEEVAEETQAMVEDAVGEAGQYDTQLIKDKKKQKSGRSPATLYPGWRFRRCSFLWSKSRKEESRRRT